MDVQQTKQAIAAVVKENGVGSITGPNMQTTLFRLLDDVNNGKADKPEDASGELLTADAEGNIIPSGIHAEDVSDHLTDTDNPHNVTKAQVGLGNVDNTSDQDKPVSTAQAQAINEVAEDLAEHAEDTNNPHHVSKAQVGLGNVDNTSDADKPISTATATALEGKVDKVAGKGLSTEDYTSDEKYKLQQIEGGAQVNVIEQVKVEGNALAPSGKAVNVTKAGLGLDQVDNTSDMNKPVSHAMHAELQGKMNIVSGSIYSEGEVAYIDRFGQAQATGIKRGYMELTDEKKLLDWKSTYGNLDLAVSSLTDLNAFILAVLSAQSSNNYTSIAPFQGVMVKVKAFPSDHLLALSWTWAGTHYALSRNSGLIVHHGIEDMYSPDYNVDFSTDFRI